MHPHEPLQVDRMHVRAWMSAPRGRVAPDTPSSEALRLMREEHVRHLLVMDGEVLLGVVADRDLTARGVADRRVSQVMSSQVIDVGPEESAASAARRMIDHGIGCLPVMSGREVVGIVTRTDLLTALCYAVEPDASWSWESAQAPR
jgi:acetoin utilization protein AcuB